MAEMKIVELEIEKIIPYENNPRRNEKAVDAVANSIKEFGFQNPIIVDKKNVIISGHTRRLAAIKLGLKTVPVYIASDMSPAQVKAFRLADNRVSELSTWNMDLLRKEIAAIQDIDLKDFGFSDSLIGFEPNDYGLKKHVCPRCGAEWADRL